MNINKANARDKKRSRHNKMVVTGKSVFVIQSKIIKRAERIKKESK